MESIKGIKFFPEKKKKKVTATNERTNQLTELKEWRASYVAFSRRIRACHRSL